MIADYEEFFELLAVACDNALDPHKVGRLEELLRDDEEAQRLYLVYLQTDGALRWEFGQVAQRIQSVADRRPWAVDGAEPLPHAPRVSSVLAFLHRMLHFRGESRLATALTWMVMAILCSGMVLTVFFCFLLIFRGIGVNVHVDAPQVAKSGEPTRGYAGAPVGSGEQRTENMRSGLPSPPAVLSGGRGAGGEGSSAPGEGSPSTSATVARLVQTYDCRWAIGSHSPHAGDDLEPGRKLVLLSGLAEIMFESGARTVLQGPATLEVASKTSAFLRQGRLTVAVIDPDARGFEIDAPGMKYTDLGTEFGVFVAKDGTQEMHVFRGQVRVEEVRSKEQGAGSPNSMLPAPRSLLLSAHQAVRVAALPGAPAYARVGGYAGAPPGKPDRPFEQFAANEKQFCRVAIEPSRFPLFSTGVGLDRGASDPHWEITRISTDAPVYQENKLGKPQLAVVAVPLGGYAPDSRDKAQWISLGFPENKHGKILANMPGGCRWTLRTHFDLTGFDPATAQIEGRASVDDYLIEVRLNGKPMPLPAGARDRSGTQSGEWLPLKIERGFAAGENVLEIVIENVVPPSSIRSMINPMAFCVDWKGTARPTLKPSTED